MDRCKGGWKDRWMNREMTGWKDRWMIGERKCKWMGQWNECTMYGKDGLGTDRWID